MELSMNWLKRSRELEAGDLLARRRAWAQQIAEAEQEHQTESAPLFLAENLARENLEQARKKAAAMIEKANRDYAEAQLQRHRADMRRDAVVGPARGNLLRTQSDKIYEFTSKLEERRRSYNYPDRQWGTDSAGREILIASSAWSIQRAAVRIGEILTQVLPPLALEPLNDVELDRRLEEIESTIPAIILEKVS